jgi:hypothetical protein
VLAAGDVRYLPVPVVTTPNVMRMPQPPEPQVPQAPQPNRGVLARILGLGPSSAGVAAPAPSNDMVNAFTPSAPMDDSALGGASAYSGAVAYSMPMPPVMRAPGLYPQPVSAMMARNMQPPAPLQPAAMPMASPMPAAPVAPPAVAYQMMVPPAVQQAAMQHAAMQQMAVQQASAIVVPDVQQALALMRDSLYPSQREWAADKLSTCKWQTHPHVVQALVQSIKDDPAPSVRAACIRSLARMDASTPVVLAALEAGKLDPEESVRREAEQALASLTPSRPTTGVQPVGATMPARP